MNILPKPYSVKKSDGEFVFSKSTVLEGLSEADKQRLYFLDYGEFEKNTLTAEICDCGAYEYVLDIKENISIKACSQDGIIHAVSTLAQMLFDGYDEKGCSVLGCVTVHDKPRFAHRGFMLDVSRHFFGVDTIKKLADILCLVKINVLHLHLSDDQGFRIESERFPELNSIGSVRKDTLGDGKEVSGYYTKQEIRDVVAYCKERGIDVLPEIDLPGHTLSVLAAYPSLGCEKKGYAVARKFGISDKILCAGEEATYEFIESLLDEITPLFPYRYFHIGGDEVPKGRWARCGKCAEMMKKQGLHNYEELQAYFTNRVINILKRHGKVAVVWNEALKSGMLDKSAMVQYWSEPNGAKRVVAAANDGRKTVVSKAFKYYLDYPYGLTSLKQCYNFEPTELRGLECGADYIVGVEAPLWTEWVDSEEKIFTQAFPRLFAVAENAWSEREKNYKEFEQRLYNMLGIMMAYEYPFTPIKESNPNIIKGWVQAAAFGIKAARGAAAKDAER